MHRGEGPATAARALSSTGISRKSPRARSGSRVASSRATLAPSEVPPTTAESSRGGRAGRHLAGEERHRVEPQVLGAVGAAVPEQVDADRPGCRARPAPAPAARTCAGSSAAHGRGRTRGRPPRRCRTRSGGPRSVNSPMPLCLPDLARDRAVPPMTISLRIALSCIDRYGASPYRLESSVKDGEGRFVGRQELLAKAREAIDSTDPPPLLCIYGSTEIGKFGRALSA